VAQGASSLGLVHGHTNVDYVSKGTSGQSTSIIAPPVQATTATNQATTATNQATTASNQATTATNQATVATNQANTATNNATVATNQAATATNNATGSGDAHNNLQPYAIMNYIIKT
jgi:microcystin-dependent protein